MPKVVMYQFDNLDELAGFFEHMAVTNRQKAAVARTAKDRNTSVTEATTFEYAASVIRSSNLFPARFLLLEEDLALASDQVAQAIRMVEETLQELGDVAVTLMRRQRELAGDPENAVPSTHPTFEDGDAD